MGAPASRSQVTDLELRAEDVAGERGVHEHACVRCSLLRPDPAQRARLTYIRDNLIARIAEAEREDWLGEVEVLQTSLAGAQDKLAQLDAEAY
ncbi:hypothetical protein ABZ890_28045 [Streptomyces sp. NPDC046984]|uniref:hypothetical protein n=1 Tax=Streptomyces sp. NPDC046984 TaxID=3155138 RepID=UPI0034047BB3